MKHTGTWSLDTKCTKCRQRTLSSLCEPCVSCVLCGLLMLHRITFGEVYDARNDERSTVAGYQKNNHGHKYRSTKKYSRFTTAHRSPLGRPGRHLPVKFWPQKTGFIWRRRAAGEKLFSQKQTAGNQLLSLHYVSECLLRKFPSSGLLTHHQKQRVWRR